MDQPRSPRHLSLSSLRALVGVLIAVLIIGGFAWSVVLDGRSQPIAYWPAAAVILVTGLGADLTLPRGRRQLRGRQQWRVPRLRLSAGLTYQARVLLVVGVVAVGALGLFLYGMAARREVSSGVMVAGMMLVHCWPTRSRILDYDAAMHAAGHESNACELYYGEPDLEALASASRGADAGTQH